MSDSDDVETKVTKRTPKVEEDSFITLTERFDQHKLNHLLKNEELYRSKMNNGVEYDADYNPFAISAKYLYKSRNGIIKTTYKQNNSFGRYYALGSLSLQSLPREVRHTVADEFYVDIDVKNCHPVILAHLCAERDITCTYLKRYNKRRDEFLSDIDLDTNAAKMTILSIINGGQSRPMDDEPEWLPLFKTEMKKIHGKFAKDKQFKIHKKARIANKKDYNHEASYMNTLLCNFENTILMVIYMTLNSPKDCVLCFDGIMVRREAVVNLKNLEKAVFIALDIKIELVVKPMTEGFEMVNVEPYVEKKVNCFDFADPYEWGNFHTEFTGGDYNECLDAIIDKYQTVIAHVLDGDGCYIKKMGNGMMSVVKSLKSSDITLVGMPRPMNMASIIAVLPNSFNKISCKLTDCSDREFNLWSGFQAVRDDTAPSEGFELIKSFIFEVWASSNLEYYNYIISWFAGLFTNLSGINRVALVMVSLQGTGKNTLSEFMKLLLRPCNVVTVEGIDGVVGRFNTILQGKRLVVMNELCSTKDEYRSNFDKIKPIISDATITIEPKGINKYEIDNISNLIAFTNHRDGIPIEESDRRYACFDMSNCHINDAVYFNNIYSKCFNQKTANQFYSYLLDFPTVDIRSIIVTDLKHEMRELSRPTPLKFLEALNEDSALKESILDGETSMKASILYTYYRTWCVENGERSILSSTKFGTSVSGVLTKRKAHGCMVYDFPVASHTDSIIPLLNVEI